VLRLLKLEDVNTEQSLQLFHVFAKAFKSVSEHSYMSCKTQGFNPTAFAVLEVLYLKGSQPIQQIGSKLLLQSGNVTYVIDKLEQTGLLRRKHCSKDRRVIYTELTEEGKAVMDKVYPEHSKALSNALQGLNKEEKDLTIRLLKKLGMAAENITPVTVKKT
jgi:MarR family 2-MHQ and catechol resistance regulon transcriptional repressor